MKPRAKIVLVGGLLIILAALASVKRDARPDSSGRSRGACCPFMPGLDGLLSSPNTNSPILDRGTNPPAATNRM